MKLTSIIKLFFVVILYGFLFSSRFFYICQTSIVQIIPKEFLLFALSEVKSCLTLLKLVKMGIFNVFFSSPKCKINNYFVPSLTHISGTLNVIQNWFLFQGENFQYAFKN